MKLVPSAGKCLAGLVLLALTAGPTLATPAPVTVLSGHLSHAPANDTVRVFYQEGHVVKGLLQADGTFQVVVPNLKVSTYGRFTYAGQQTSLYLSPGDQLALTLDFLKFDESLRFAGRGEAANNYLAQWLWKFVYGPGSSQRPDKLLKPGTTPPQMQQQADAFRQQEHLFLASYARAHPLPAAFRRDAALHLDLDWAICQLNYVSYYRRDQLGESLPASYFDFLRQLPLRTLDTYPSREPNPEITGLLASFFEAYHFRLIPHASYSSVDFTKTEQLYAQATADFGLTKSRDAAMFAFYRFAMESPLDAVPILAAAYPTIRAQSRDSVGSRQFRQVVQRYLRLQPGREAPAFTLRDHTGQPVSLADFRGKVVYLDFWGTWCGPCMQQMTEFAPAIKAKFAGKDVVFLYVSVGDAELKWRRTLAENHFLEENSVHLREPANTGGVADAYGVRQFPTYFLIGRDGRILNRDAPRPSHGDKLVVALEQALAK